MLLLKEPMPSLFSSDSYEGTFPFSSAYVCMIFSADAIKSIITIHDWTNQRKRNWRALCPAHCAKDTCMLTYRTNHKRRKRKAVDWRCNVCLLSVNVVQVAISLEHLLLGRSPPDSTLAFPSSLQGNTGVLTRNVFGKQLHGRASTIL
jgi:hypothetical protein